MIGTSFCWQLAGQLQQSGHWGEVHLNYYNNIIYPMVAVSEHKLEVGSPVWRTATLDKELYVLDLFEGYLVGGAYVDGFLDDAAAALMAGEPPPPPRPR